MQNSLFFSSSTHPALVRETLRYTNLQEAGSEIPEGKGGRSLMTYPELSERACWPWLGMKMCWGSYGGTRIATSVNLDDLHGPQAPALKLRPFLHWSLNLPLCSFGIRPAWGAALWRRHCEKGKENRERENEGAM